VHVVHPEFLDDDILIGKRITIVAESDIDDSLESIVLQELQLFPCRLTGAGKYR
jgi:hypothetical protein